MRLQRFPFPLDSTLTGSWRPSPVSDRLLPRGELRLRVSRRQFRQRAPILDRHHLTELGQTGVPVLKNPPGAGRASGARVIGDKLMKPLGIETAHVAHHVDPTMRLKVAA